MHFCKTNMVRLVGFEPTPDFSDHPLKVACLPFHHNRISLGIRGHKSYRRYRLKHGLHPKTPVNSSPLSLKVYV